MGLFGEGKKDKELRKLKEDVSALHKQNDAFISRINRVNKRMTDSITRPSLSAPYMSTDTGAKLAIYPFPLIMIQDLAKNDDSLRIPIEALIREMFKNGFEISEKYKYKCMNCSKEFQFKPEPEDEIEEDKETIDTHDEARFEVDEEEGDEAPPEGLNKGYGGKFKWMNRLKYVRKDYDDKTLVCDECGVKALRRPDPTHRKVLDQLINNPVNGNMQTLEDVCYQVERDLEECDNLYLGILKTYDIDDFSHEIVGWQIAELLRFDPPQVALIVDSDGRMGYDDNGNRVYVCPRFEHRNKRLIKPFCDKCGTRALRALVETNSVYSIGIPQPKRVVYGEGEVIWKAGKYYPGLVYGYSIIFAIWSKVMALAHMDEYVRKYFDKMRPPRGLLVMASRNWDSFKKSWEQLEQKATEDPYEIYPVMIETDNGGKNMAQWIDFTGSLRELEFVEVRDELRRIISAAFGVPPMWFGEVNSGWNQEGLQMTSLNRIVTWGQSVLKKAVLDKVCKLVGVDDWELKLKIGDEADKLRQVQLEGAEINNAEAMLRMGFEVTRTHDGKFRYSKTPKLGKQPTTETGGGNLSSAKTNPKVEDTTDHQGEHLSKRPSDTGGMAQGHPASGQNTSQSKKSRGGKTHE